MLGSATSVVRSRLVGTEKFSVFVIGSGNAIICVKVEGKPVAIDAKYHKSCMTKLFQDARTS